MKLKSLKFLGILGCSLILANGCANNPVALSNKITLQDIQIAPERYQGQMVRLGGKIVRVSNLATSTELEIVSLDINSSGRPRGDNSTGRFIANVSGFLDPAVYANNRLFTVVGTVNGVQQSKVGEQVLLMPKIQVQSYRLWDDPPKTIYVEDPSPFRGRFYYGSGFHHHSGFGIGVPF